MAPAGLGYEDSRRLVGELNVPHRQPEGGPAVGLDFPETGVPVRVSVCQCGALFRALELEGGMDGSECFACV